MLSSKNDPNAERNGLVDLGAGGSLRTQELRKGS